MSDFIPQVLGSEVVVKWFSNPAARPADVNPTRLLSKTLGKFSYVDRNYTGPMPADGSIWVARIVHETNPGQPKGCFMVEPLSEVPKDDDTGEYLITRLLPGWGRQVRKSGIEFHLPPQQFDKHGQRQYWILPGGYKQRLGRSIYATLVVLNAPTDGGR